MKTRILPLALLGAALSGCIQENYASLEFYGVCAGPTPDTTTGACVYSASCDLYALFTYWYDPAVVSELLVPIEMFNQLPNNADLSAGRVNTNDAIIEEWTRTRGRSRVGWMERKMRSSTTMAYAAASAAASTTVAKPLATETTTRVGSPRSHFAAQSAASASRGRSGVRGAPALTPTRTP